MIETFAPSARSSLAVAKPIPLLPPVIKATLFCTLKALLQILCIYATQGGEPLDEIRVLSGGILHFALQSAGDLLLIYLESGPLLWASFNIKALLPGVGEL